MDLKEKSPSKDIAAPQKRFDHKIMIVENDKSMRVFLEALLRREGFHDIYLFDEPRKAIAHVKSSTRPALVITAFAMRQLDGAELLLELDTLCPGIDGIVVTDAIWNAFAGLGGFPILPKGKFMDKVLMKYIAKVLQLNLK